VARLVVQWKDKSAVPLVVLLEGGRVFCGYSGECLEFVGGSVGGEVGHTIGGSVWGIRWRLHRRFRRGKCWRFRGRIRWRCG